VRSFARTQTEIRLATLLETLRAAAEQPTNPEAIHDVRVASRRFVQCLKTFGQLFGAKATATIRKQLRKLMDGARMFETAT
jgi:CHAD domain-containing protein